MDRSALGPRADMCCIVIHEIGEIYQLTVENLSYNPVLDTHIIRWTQECFNHFCTGNVQIFHGAVVSSQGLWLAGLHELSGEHWLLQSMFEIRLNW